MKSIITEIFFSENVTLVTIENIPGVSGIVEILSEISDANINIDMISQTPPQGGTISLSFSFNDNCLKKVLIILGRIKERSPKLSTVASASNLKISFLSKEMRYTPGVGAQVFSVLSGLGCQFKLITTSTDDISVLIDSSEASRILESIGTAFSLTPERIEP